MAQIHIDTAQLNNQIEKMNVLMQYVASSRKDAPSLSGAGTVADHLELFGNSISEMSEDLENLARITGAFLGDAKESYRNTDDTVSQKFGE